MFKTKKNLFYLITVLTLFIFSCATYRPLYTDPELLTSALNKGDKVKINTINDEEISLKVDHLTEEAIVGDKRTVLFTEIGEIKIMTSSTEKNIFVGILYGLLITSYVVLAPAAYCY